MPDRLPGVIAQPASLGRQATPQDFGGGEGKIVLGEALGRVAQATDAIATAEYNSRVRLARARAAGEVGSWLDEHKADPDPDTLEERFEEFAGEVRGRHAEGLGGTWGREFEADFEELHLEARAKTADLVRARRIDKTLANGIEERQHWLDAGVKSGDFERTEQWLETSYAEELAIGARTEEQIAEQRIKDKLSLASGYSEKMLVENPEALLVEIQNNPWWNTVGQEAKEKLENAARTEIRAQERARRAEDRALEAQANRMRKALKDEASMFLAGKLADGTLERGDVMRVAPLLGASVGAWLDRAAGGEAGKNLASIPPAYASIAKERVIARTPGALVLRPDQRPQPTKDEVWAEFEAMQERYLGEVAALSDRELAEHEVDPVLAGVHLDTIMARVRAANESKASPSRTFASRVGTRWEAVRDVQWGWDFDAAKGGKPTDEPGREFWGMAETERIRFVEREKREPNDTEAEQILDKIEKDFVVRYGTRGKGLSGLPELNERGPLSDLDPAFVAKARQLIESQPGGVASNAAIRALWNDYLELEAKKKAAK